MKHIKSICILLVMTIAYSCSPNRIEVGNISTRAQLDSVIALLPSDSVTIDSLNHRRLGITLRGNFSIFNQPVQKIVYNLVEEELIAMNPIGIKLKLLPMLNHMEEIYGIGRYNGPGFIWERNNTTITLKEDYSNTWGNWSQSPEVRLNELQDTVPATISFEYDGVGQNKIIDLAKNRIADNQYSYYLVEDRREYESYTVHINDIASAGSDNRDYYFSSPDEKELESINHMLSAKGLQTVTFLFQGNEDKQHHTSTIDIMPVRVMKMDRKSMQHSEVAHFEVNISQAYVGQKQEFKFEVPDLPYTMDYADGIDLRTVSNIKEQMYAQYQALQKAYEGYKREELIEMLYPVAKTNAAAYNYDYKQLALYCQQRMIVARANEGVLLLDSNDLNVEFAANGKLARLVSKSNTKEAKLAPLTAYITDSSSRDYIDYYFYMDKNNKLNFATE